jgi:hypothetical protein
MHASGLVKRIRALAFLLTVALLLAGNQCEESREDAARMNEGDGPTTSQVVIYFKPGVTPSAKGTRFTAPAGADDSSQAQLQALNQRIASENPEEIAPLFEGAHLGEVPEGLAAAFEIFLPEGHPASRVDSLVQDLSENPLVDEVYVPGLGVPPGAGGAGAPRPGK